MEKALIQWLTDRFGQSRFAKIGIGDDCAVLPRTDSELVLTCDAICDGVHFRSPELSAEQIGRKALAVNLSDLASMGAVPKTAIVSLSIPRSRTFSYVQQLFLGMQPLLDQYDVEICGGDTTVWDGELVISVTAIGTAPGRGVWTIGDARPDDRIVVTGSFGGSIVRHHWAFEPRLAVANQWRDCDLVQACTDVSDSLSIDLAKIATASGVGFQIDAGVIPVSDDARNLALTKANERSELDHALYDGEDFELILAVDPNRVQQFLQETDQTVPVTDIGCFTSNGEFTIVEDGQSRKLVPDGYEHKVSESL